MQRVLLATAAFVLSFAPLATAATPFNGKDLRGWSFKKHGARNKTMWTVGAASLNPEDPRLFRVDPEGGELINNVTGHGQGVDIYSDAKFGDAVITLEVMVPKGSNSGIYLMGEYEVQVLDSFGKENNPGQGDMGAIYGAAPPKGPVYKRPGEWSTYEIHWQAPRFEGERKTRNARFIKVVLNGRTIHENVEMPKPTPGGIDGREKPQGPLMFQGDHGPVAFRNIRVEPLKAGAGASIDRDAPLARSARPALCDRSAEDSDSTIVLFGGADLSKWQSDKGGDVKWTVEDGVLTIAPGTGNIMTRQNFNDFKLHVEFMIHPTDRKADSANTQDYGNSGVYIQRRYEIQILDSHGRPPEENGCGAIYKQRKPATNASKPAGQWQTYDITFHAPRWEGERKVKNARATVVHNGVTIHDDAEITGKTGAGQPEAPAPGPILLQEHGNPVSFRNITITPLD